MGRAEDGEEKGAEFVEEPGSLVLASHLQNPEPKREENGEDEDEEGSGTREKKNKGRRGSF